MPWFELIAGGDPNDPNDYNSVGSTSCPGLPNHVCSVQAAASTNNKPIFTTALRNEMITALNDNANGPNVLLRETR